MPDIDLVVLGGGLAGLSLAERLSAAGDRAPRTLVLEARARYEDDRTWCFWRLEPHRYDALAAASWSRFVVRDRGREATCECADTPYQMIPSGAFYEHARDAIAGSPNVTLELGSAVTAAPVRQGDAWRVEREGGAAVLARHVVDTRPPQQRPDSILWQSFVGDVVETAHDAFDPSAAVLMDFDEACEDGVQFVYVLPTSRRRALVETTVFGPRPLAADALAERQATHVRARAAGADYAVLRSEHGVLPMGHAPLPASGVVRASLFHGGARASTGYAFQRIQAWADACAASLLTRGVPRPPAREPWLRRVMDEVFLRVLRAQPARGGAMLFGMFERAEPGRVIRFLSDRGGLRDALAVVGALPPGPFLHQSVRAMLRAPCRGSA